MSDEQEPPFEDDPELHDDEPRGRAESLIASVVKRALQQGVDALSDEKVRETVVAETIRKAFSRGAGMVDTTEDSVRRWLGDLPVPKEAADRIAIKLDEYKSDLMRIVRDEVHEFLEHVDLGQELQKVLTSLSFEISTEIRFVPNERAAGKAQVRPDVKARARVKRNSRRKGAKDAPESE